jgi:tyrosinase
MGNPVNSINDPLFFMHHGAMDYLWTIWQGDDEKRLHDLDVSKSGTKNTESAAAVMSVGVLGPDRKASELADTQNRDGTGVLCYKYAGLDAKSYLS